LHVALTIADEAQQKKLDSPDLRITLYSLAFIQNDVTAMKQQLSYARRKTAFEHWFLSAEADTASYHGKLVKARELTRRAVESAERADQKRNGGYL
jgi:hypothetical protein